MSSPTGNHNFFRPQKKSLWISLGIVLLTIAVYGQVGHHAFIDFDDYEYITENPHVRTGLTFDNIAWAFTSHHSNNWHPLTWISHMVDVEIFGLNPGGHHLVNVAFHVVNSLLLMALLRLLTGALWPSAFTAALFALHPLHVESVAWAAERKDVLSCFFWLLTIFMYIRYVRRPDWRRYLSMTAVFALGLTAKQMLVTLPFVLLLLDFWPLGRMTRLSFRLGTGKDKKPGPLAGGPGGKNGAKRHPSEHVGSLDDKTGATPTAKRHGGRKGIPANLTPEDKRIAGWGERHGGRKGASETSTGAADKALRAPTPPPWIVAAPTAPVRRLIIEKIPLLILATAASIIVFTVQLKSGVLYNLPQFPLAVRLENALVSYVAYLGKTFWPLNLAVFYPHPLHTLPLWKAVGAGGLLLAVSTAVLRLGKRHPYLPVGWFWYLGTLIPVIGLIQVGVQAMADRYTYIPLIGIFIMVAWGGWDLTRRINGVSAAENASIGSQGGSISGREKSKRDTPFPERSQTRIVQRSPSSRIAGGLALTVVLALSFLTWKQTGYWRDNVTLYEHAIRVVPDNYWAYNNLGAALAARGQMEEAEDLFMKSLAIMPAYPGANRNMAVAMYKKGEYAAALPFLATALKVQPGNPELHYTRGAVLLKLRRHEEAAAAFRESLALRPGDPDAAGGLREASAAGGK